jgi:hypothetical protein
MIAHPRQFRHGGYQLRLVVGMELKASRTRGTYCIDACAQFLLSCMRCRMFGRLVVLENRSGLSMSDKVGHEIMPFKKHVSTYLCWKQHLELGCDMSCLGYGILKLPIWAEALIKSLIGNCAPLSPPPVRAMPHQGSLEDTIEFCPSSATSIVCRTKCAVHMLIWVADDGKGVAGDCIEVHTINLRTP